MLILLWISILYNASAQNGVAVNVAFDATYMISTTAPGPAHAKNYYSFGSEVIVEYPSFSNAVSFHFGGALKMGTYSMSKESMSEMSRDEISILAESRSSNVGGYTMTQFTFGAPIYFRLNLKNWKVSPYLESGVFFGKTSNMYNFDNGLINTRKSGGVEEIIHLGAALNISRSHLIGLFWASENVIASKAEIRF